MKILLTNTKSIGGAANACIRLHKGLLGSRIDSNLLTLQKSNNDPIPSHHGFVDKFSLGQKLYLLHSKLIAKLNNLEIYEPITAPFEIQNTKLFINTDIINLHWTTRFLDYPSFFKSNKKPIVWTLHDMQPFTGGYPYRGGVDINKAIFKKNVAMKKKILCDQDIHVVCLSKWMMNESLNSELFHRFPHYLIPNSVDTNIYRNKPKKELRLKYNLDPQKKVLLFVAENLSNVRKGYAILLKTLERLDLHNTYVVAVGHVQKAKSKLISKYTGYIKSELEMSEWYALADIFVIASIEDNLPNTVMESICCGTPVVGFNIGGIPDLISNGENGFLTDEINAVDLGKSIELALKYSWDSNTIQQKAHKLYSSKVQATHYIKLFEEIISQNE